jgi:hypothetical protein
MSTQFGSRILALGTILAVIITGTHAQETVYKWVDKEGVVHFSEAPPDASEAVNVETITTAKAPPYTPPPKPTEKPPPTAAETAPPEPAPPPPPPAETTDLTAMSLAELDRRCEQEREQRIAPLREAEIEKCIQQDRKEPDYCKRYFADYGNAGRTIHGTFRPRMFHDLPECLEAEKRRQARW